jgi:hypothetical protein
MIDAIKVMTLLALCAAGPAVAQQQAAPPAETPAAPAVAPATAPAASSPKPARATAQSEAGDPRAGTSNDPATAPTPSATPSAVPAPSTTGRAPTGRAAPGLGSGQKQAPRIDRLDLGTATVTGDREQPKVMYVVPWKRSDIGDLEGKPMNSLVDEILAPVDRDVFKREVVYYHAVQADTSQNGASPTGQQGEK